ncbi:MAG: RNB domain-containing ribonuclease [bacterium]|nr:RNB domain-containing ribonuclease [bacterium]
MIYCLIYLNKVNKEIFLNLNDFDIVKPLLIKLENKNLVGSKKQILRYIYYFFDEESYIFDGNQAVHVENYDLKKRLLFFLSLNPHFYSIKFFKDYDKLIKFMKKINFVYFLLKKSIMLYRLLLRSIKVPHFTQGSWDILKKNMEYCINSRKYVNFIDFYTFDDKGTIEYDDAIGFKRLKNGFEIYVAVSDLSEVWNIHMDKSVLEFPQTLYSIDSKYYMLPSNYIEFLALKKGAERPAFLFNFCLTKELEIKNYFFEPVIISVKRNLSYNQGDQFIRENNFIYKFAINLLRKRVSNGAIYFDEYKGMKFVIQELMILVNHICAKVLSKNNIPFISRVLEIPAELQRYRGKIYDLRKDTFKILKYKILNLLGNAKYDIGNHGHDILGLDKYTHITSPIRRYIDVINQKQLISYYYNFDEFFTFYELKDILKIIGPVLQKYNCLIKNYNKKQKIIKLMNELNNLNNNNQSFLFYENGENTFLILEKIDEEVKVGDHKILKNKLISNNRIVFSRDEILQILYDEINDHECKEGM